MRGIKTKEEHALYQQKEKMTAHVLAKTLNKQKKLASTPFASLKRCLRNILVGGTYFAIYVIVFLSNRTCCANHTNFVVGLQ